MVKYTNYKNYMNTFNNIYYVKKIIKLQTLYLNKKILN